MRELACHTDFSRCTNTAIIAAAAAAAATAADYCASSSECRRESATDL